MTVRPPAERVAWLLAHKPAAPGRCAEHVMHALDAPRQGLPDATAVYRATVAAGHPMSFGVAPKGAIHFWTAGSAGHGHAALAVGDDLIASVDVHGPGTVGIKRLGWVHTNWPALRYQGWSWWWGRIDTQPATIEEAAVTAPRTGLALKAWAVGRQLLLKRKGPSKTVPVPGGTWTTLGVIDTPKGARVKATLQVRMPRGVGNGEAALARLGWGDAKPGQRDETGGNPIPAASAVRRWRTPIEGHSLAGGGPLEARIWLPKRQDGKPHAVEFVYKVERTA